MTNVPVNGKVYRGMAKYTLISNRLNSCAPAFLAEGWRSNLLIDLGQEFPVLKTIM